MGYLSIDSITVGTARYDNVPGGGALYGALGARAAGADVSLLAACGDDFTQDWLDALAEFGIDMSGVVRREGPTRRARLAHGIDGGRASPHHGEGTWRERTEAMLPPLPENLEADAIMLAPMPLAHVVRCIDQATGPLIVDTSEAFADEGLLPWLALLPQLDIFAPSREETRLLCPDRDDDNAVRVLAALGCDVVQKRGADGLALCRAGSSRIVTCPAATTSVVDPTGAGDAVVGALASGLAHGLDLEDNARQAARIGARAVTGIGAAAMCAGFGP